MVPYRIYSILAIFELCLVFLLAISVILKKKRLTSIVIVLKILIHILVVYDLYWAITHPLIESTIELYTPMAVRNGISVIILLITLYFQIKGKYKKAFITMLILLCLDFCSVFLYYPMFMDYFINRCEYCTKDIMEISHLAFIQPKSPVLLMVEKRAFLLLMWTASAPFRSGSVRILITLVESILFIVQYKKVKEK